jgi:SAM-dependent methyltransferase
MNTKEYWEERLKRFSGLEGVGCMGLGDLFNSYLYRAKVRTLENAARRFNISFRGEVLDVGSGIGFWIDYYLAKGAKQICGVDLTSEAFKHLTRNFGRYENVMLLQGDFAHLNVGKKFDIVNAFDVAYHVVDDDLFMKFVRNCCTHLRGFSISLPSLLLR